MKGMLQHGKINIPTIFIYQSLLPASKQLRIKRLLTTLKQRIMQQF